MFNTFKEEIPLEILILMEVIMLNTSQPIMDIKIVDKTLNTFKEEIMFNTFKEDLMLNTSQPIMDMQIILILQS